jgi:hypothetical protein
MIKSSFELKDVLKAICNDNTLNLSENALDEEYWKVLKTVSNFLETAAEITTLLSGSGYATLSLQPLTFKKLVKHCEKTIADVSACRDVRSASVSYQATIMKYEQNLTSDLALLALALDTRSGKKGDWVNDMKSRVRTVLSSKYGVGLHSQTSAQPKQSTFFETEELDDDVYAGDEVDDFFDVTQRPDPSCREVLL